MTQKACRGGRGNIGDERETRESWLCKLSLKHLIFLCQQEGGLVQKCELMKAAFQSDTSNEGKLGGQRGRGKLGRPGRKNDLVGVSSGPVGGFHRVEVCLTTDPGEAQLFPVLWSRNPS